MAWRILLFRFWDLKGKLKYAHSRQHSILTEHDFSNLSRIKHLFSDRDSNREHDRTISREFDLACGMSCEERRLQSQIYIKRLEFYHQSMFLSVGWMIYRSEINSSVNQPWVDILIAYVPMSQWAFISSPTSDWTYQNSLRDAHCTCTTTYPFYRVMWLSGLA